MSKSIMRVFSIFLCSICVFFCTSCESSLQDGTESAKSEPVTITQLNQPFENSNVKVEISEIHAYENTSDLENGDIIININYTVENLSSEYSFYSSRRSIDVYADDIAVIFRSTHASLAPGKKANLVCEAYAFKNTKHIEFYYSDPKSTGYVAIFQLDIPPIEESTTAS